VNEVKSRNITQSIRLIVTTLLMCTFAEGKPQENKPNQPDKPEQQVLALNQTWAEAITKGDAAALGRLFADDVIVTSGSGEIRDKAGEIRDAAGGPDPDFVWTHPFTTSDVRVRVYNDAAVVTGLAKWGFKYKGQEVGQERRYTHLYVRKQGQWQIVAQQVSLNLYKKPQAPRQ
jgi:uncharacterized protein (TIGR02246 family)